MVRLAGVDKCVEWCERMVAQAAEAGNYTDWQNYTTLLNQWKERNRG
nr:MAG TPA: hypothetical protein [Caudoviricetes sp.]